MSKRILLVIPSAVIARGLEQIFRDLGEFEVCGIVSDLSGAFRSIRPDVVILDPDIFDAASRERGKSLVAEHGNAAVLAVVSGSWNEEQLKQYDGVIGLYDSPAAIVHKTRMAVESLGDRPRAEGEELSLREKEILVCVAKGMLNKEIADAFNLSIHTVITHRKNITRKTGIKTVAGLTVYALLNNLIDLNSIE